MEKDITTLNVWSRTNDRFNELYEQFCTKMGMKCTKLEFADIVVEHFDLLQEAQRKVEAIEHDCQEGEK